MRVLRWTAPGEPVHRFSLAIERCLRQQVFRRRRMENQMECSPGTGHCRTRRRVWGTLFVVLLIAGLYYGVGRISWPETPLRVASGQYGALADRQATDGGRGTRIRATELAGGAEW